MSDNSLFEISRCSIRVSQHQETQLSSSNGPLVIITDEGLNVFNYSYNIRCTDAKIDHSLYFVPALKKSPATDLFKLLIWKGVKNSQMTEMVLDSTLWPHNRQLLEEATKVITASWSPVGFMPHTEQVLAILNCAGNVDIYVQKLHKWKNNLDISSLICQQFPEYLNVKNISFESARQSAHALATNSVCWASKLNEDKSCYFVTAQKNGCILLWSLFSEGSNIQGNCIGMFDSKLTAIGNMVWISKVQNKFLLLCSTLKGLLVGFDCEIDSNILSVQETHKIWAHEDQMFAKLIHYTEIDNYSIFIFNKYRHLVLQMYDKNLKLIYQDIRKVNDYRITDFVNSPDGLLITTVNTNIFRININLLDNKLEMYMTPIDILDMPPSMELYGLSLTSNKLIYILAMADRKLKFRKEPDLNEVIFATSNKNLNNAMDTLLNNQSKKLTDCWDCIELLRYKIHKTKKLPEMDYDQLYTDAEKDVYKLKIYLILLIFYKELGIMKNYYIKMPETSIEYVKEQLLVSHAVKLIQDLEARYHNNGIWNGNDMEYMIGAKNYLEIFCHKRKKHIQDLTNTKIFNEINTKIDYTCQCCEEILEKLVCKKGHINMLCSLTFTPILAEEYLFCKLCGVTARTDLGAIEPFCVFCDNRLYKYE